MLPFTLVYLETFHRDTGYRQGSRQVLGHWSDLPLDLQILLPVTMIVHLIAIISAVRLVVLRQELGTREELGE